jgi:trimethylamine--corrinoid protein Co-methyltransferase
VLSETDKARIHASTLEVLLKTGVFVEDEQALEIFDGGGCTIDPKTRMVKIPPHVVEDAIQSSPEIVLMAGRDPKDDVILEMGRVSFSCFGTARIIDYLDNVETNRRSVSAYEVPQAVAAVHDAEALLLNTTKHILTTSYNAYMTKQIIKMLVAIVGSEERLKERPLITFNNCAVTPLKLPKECCEIIIECARVGLTVTVLSQALAGGSSPVTLAGTLEATLSCILVRPAV